MTKSKERASFVNGFYFLRIKRLTWALWPMACLLMGTFSEASVFFNDLPRVALLVKEQYVDPKRIKPDAMLASILESLESRITKLVVTLPKSLEKALDESRATEEQLARISKLEVATKAPAQTNEALSSEKLIIDLGGSKKTFDYESKRSIWGMIFLLRDIFRFVEAEAKKQGLTEKTKIGEEPLDWEKIENGAINAMLSTLDPHSVFLEAKYARDLTLTTKGEFGGIGIVISVRDGFLTVISPMDGTPAAVAGVKAKDRIIKIDDESAINMDLNDAVNLLRGKPNTTVRITVQRANPAKEMEFSLKRAIIKVDSVAYALLDKEVGYLRIKAFQGNTATDVKDGILALKKKSVGKLNGLILDLRGNPGGLLREAVEIANLFLDGGEVVSTQGARPDSRQVEMATAGELDPNLKIAVLVDGGSASASEIVAGAIKSGGLKNGRGVVVGEPTFGKGSVQMLFDFPAISEEVSSKNQKGKPVEPAALKLTIAEYFGPNKTSIQTVGVIPDIKLSEVHADKREELSLFPEVVMREVDLEGHLSTEKQANQTSEQSLVNIEYLASKPDEETTEYSKLDVASLKKDFAVTVAAELIRAAKRVDRSDLLGNAQAVKAKLQNEEHNKIFLALKKFNIDWSEGVSESKGSLKANIVENKPTIAGNKLNLSVKIKNTGSEPLYQVHGITHSKTPLFDQKEFLFGKLMPGQEITRNVEFDIPKDVVSRRDLLSLELRDYRREKISEIDIPLEIKGLGRPRFAHLVYIDDSSMGNGDGRVEKGEDVELTVWLKNIGDGKAFEPTVLLRNESGSKVFLKNGRFQSKELLPNQETSMKFAFRVKEPTDKVEFEIQIFDGQMHDIWRDKVAVDISPKHNAKAISRTVAVKDEVGSLLAKPVEGSQKIATIKPGFSFTAIKEIGDYLLVKLDTDLFGFIKRTEVKDTKASLAPNQKKSDFYTIHYDRIPAIVSLKFGDSSGLSKTEAGLITAEIDHAEKLSALLLYVNGKKVLYKDISKATGKEKLSHSINLKPGVNIISLFAKEDATYGQRENITVYYDEDGRAFKAIDQPKEAKVN